MIGRSSRARHRTVTASNRRDLTRPQTQQQLNERFRLFLGNPMPRIRDNGFPYIVGHAAS